LALPLERILHTQGFGTRNACAWLVRSGEVAVEGETCCDPDARFEPQGLSFEVGGQVWRYREFAYLALHKPAGYECSARPSHHASVFALLPAPLVNRGVQSVGRLDADTTGLLLFSDDGQFVHRLASPRHKVNKVYRVDTCDVVEEAQIQALLAGVVLRDDPVAIRSVACEQLAARQLRLTIAEGKYHQVKRMLAAAGNRVQALHREAIGDFSLPADLGHGQWMWLEDAVVARLLGGDSDPARALP
jgi:16S rRNA pseudouridine516 synthase